MNRLENEQFMEDFVDLFFFYEFCCWRYFFISRKKKK